MKTKKEFPATHSMSTEWFVADEEGNIALFDFDENGPVPVDIPSERDSYLMTAENDFGEIDSDSIEYLELNDEQVAELMSDAVPPEKFNFEDGYDIFFQIDESNKKEFFDVFIDRIDFCLSHKYGIYFINCLFEYEESDSDKKKDKEIFLKTVKRAVHIDIGAYTDEDFSEDNKKWKLPFYCYKQPYNSNAYLP